MIEAKAGFKVLSGGINTDGLIEVKVEKTYEDSTVSQILNLVENATDKKAKTETRVSKMARIYTPTVFILAILVAVFMPLIFANVTYSQSVYKALTFLVISCPCSIAISVPLSYFSGIGKSSKSGILVKGSDYLDGLKDIKTQQREYKRLFYNKVYTQYQNVLDTFVQDKYTLKGAIAKASYNGQLRRSKAADFVVRVMFVLGML